jgi:hypothetical protein
MSGLGGVTIGGGTGVATSGVLIGVAAGDVLIGVAVAGAFIGVAVTGRPTGVAVTGGPTGVAVTGIPACARATGPACAKVSVPEAGSSAAAAVAWPGMLAAVPRHTTAMKRPLENATPPKMATVNRAGTPTADSVFSVAA